MGEGMKVLRSLRDVQTQSCYLTCFWKLPADEQYRFWNLSCTLVKSRIHRFSMIGLDTTWRWDGRPEAYDIHDSTLISIWCSTLSWSLGLNEHIKQFKRAACSDRIVLFLSESAQSAVGGKVVAHGTRTP